MGLRLGKYVGSLAAAVAVALAPASVSAGTLDSLFGKLSGILKQAGVDPDQIEFARFVIKYPSEGATVVSRAIGQDYPFFALVATVKAAKGRDFPGVGTFTYDKCVMPVTAVDVVFAKADGGITSAQGKASTNALSGAAADYAAQLAKAQTAQAKEKVVAEMTAAIPYFGDLPTICRFGFETDLVAERQAKAAAGGAVKAVVKTYKAFKSGDVVTGVQTLMTLGVSGSAACGFVDQSVSGGVIGRTPILGDLAKGACSGFVGAIIDGVNGIIKGGVGLVEDTVSAVYGTGKKAACALYSLVGSGCSKRPPPDYATQVLTSAKKWCTPYGGFASLSMGPENLSASGVSQPSRQGPATPGPSETTVAPNSPYKFSCNDKSSCRRRGNGTVACVVEADRVAYQAQRRALLDAEYKAFASWQQSFQSRWSAQCPAGDSGCRTAVSGIIAAVLSKTAFYKSNGASYAKLVNEELLPAEDRAATAVEDARFRVLPKQWAITYDRRWSDGCEDDQCRTALKFMTTGTLHAVKQRRAVKAKASYASMLPIFAEANRAAPGVIAASKARAAKFNRQTTNAASSGWEAIAIGAWQPRCADGKCRDEIVTLAGKMAMAARLLQLAHPDESSLKVQGMASKEYGPKFQAAVDASKARAAAAPAAAGSRPGVILRRPDAAGAVPPAPSSNGRPPPSSRTPIPTPLAANGPTRPRGPVIIRRLPPPTR